MDVTAEEITKIVEHVSVADKGPNSWEDDLWLHTLNLITLAERKGIIEKRERSQTFPTVEDWRQLEDAELDDCPKCKERVDWWGYFKEVIENEPSLELFVCPNCGYARDA